MGSRCRKTISWKNYCTKPKLQFWQTIFALMVSVSVKPVLMPCRDKPHSVGCLCLLHLLVFGSERQRGSRKGSWFTHACVSCTCVSMRVCLPVQPSIYCLLLSTPLSPSAPLGTDPHGLPLVLLSPPAHAAHACTPRLRTGLSKLTIIFS